ncbi:MAG: hypothetical protein ACM3JD_14025 [Rudaea sp.]
MRALAAEELIEVDRRGIRILDPAGLKTRADVDD